MNIYAENIKDHYLNPHNFDPNITPNGKSINLSCGDEIYVKLDISSGIVTNCKFTGAGCSIAIGTMSMLSDYIENMSVTEVKEIGVETLNSLIGVAINPARIKCLTIGLEAIKEALEASL